MSQPPDDFADNLVNADDPHLSRLRHLIVKVWPTKRGLMSQSHTSNDTREAQRDHANR